MMLIKCICLIVWTNNRVGANGAVGSALPLQGRGHRFDSGFVHLFFPIQNLTVAWVRKVKFKRGIVHHTEYTFAQANIYSTIS